MKHDSNRKKLSLKLRIFIIFFGILLLMLCTYSFTVTRFITRFTEKQLNDVYHDLLSKTSQTVENLLWNLTLTSGQILDNDEILNAVMAYQDTEDLYTRQSHYSKLLDDISILTLANTDIALMYIYDNAQDDFIYSSLPANGNQRINQPVLYENSAFSFCGPCKSQSYYIGNPVLSLNRTETLSNGRTITLSIESGYYSLDEPFQTVQQYSAYLAFTNTDDTLIYSTFPKDTDVSSLLAALADEEISSYRSMQKTMSQGWNIHLIIPTNIYARNYYASMRDVILCTVVVALFVCIIAVYFWRSVYSPLQLFDKQLGIILSDNILKEQMHSSIPEYDHLLKKIVVLQKQIHEMIDRIIVQEQLNTRIQTEKLRAQINPHFLLNTLNTIHWMALINEQPDIDHITQSLAHLLSYNLDKDSISTILEKELSALQEYVELQKVRYHFQFQIEKSGTVSELNYPCPKFLLQPLVENALIHGFRDGMSITVHIFISDWIELTVSDTGTGMAKETLTQLNKLAQETFSSSQNTRSEKNTEITQFGIGLQYVIKSMADFYKQNCLFSVSSTPDTGTVIYIKFPKQKGGGYHVENSDCR